MIRASEKELWLMIRSGMGYGDVPQRRRLHGTQTRGGGQSLVKHLAASYSIRWNAINVRYIEDWVAS